MVLTQLKKTAALALLAALTIVGAGMLGRHAVAARPGPAHARDEAPTAVREKENRPAELQAVLDKAIKAAGGADQLNKLSRVTCRAEGTAVFPSGGDKERKLSFTASLQGLDECRLDSITAFNRANLVIAVFKREYKDLDGWLDNPMDLKPGSTVIPGAGFGDDLYAIRLAQWLVPLQDKAVEMSFLGDLKIGERQTVGVKFACKDRPCVDLYFDKETGLPVKAKIDVPVKAGGMEQVVVDEMFFGDYKESDGVKHFTKLTFQRDGKKRMEVGLSDIAPQTKFDAKSFAKP